MSRKHTCQAVVLHCIDWRFQGSIHEHLRRECPGQFDRITVAGSIRDLLDQRQSRWFRFFQSLLSRLCAPCGLLTRKDYLLSQIAVSLKLHEPTVLVLLQHEDCGAYGGSGNFADVEKEKKFHKSELSRAAELLLKEYPAIQTVRKFFVTLSGQFIEL